MTIAPLELMVWPNAIVFALNNKLKPLVLLMVLVLTSPSTLADAPLLVSVADPYIELHTGPGRGYPVFHVAEKGEFIEIIKQRTDWFKVRTKRYQEGWVKREQLARTLLPGGEQISLQHPRFGDLKNSRWDLGLAAGDFEGAESLTAHVGYHFTNNLSINVAATRAVGNFSDHSLVNISIQNQPFPNWRISPWFGLGAGLIKTEPAATLVQTEDRTDNSLHVGAGARIYLTRNLIFRVEYRNYIILTSRNQNEEAAEWRAGLCVFF